ncbi:MAG: STAS domain-containing protein [Chloroflexi bacterium]|nr:STAS domain-containing protein [Chloroflexota bacterium]
MKSDLIITSETIQTQNGASVIALHLQGWLDGQTEGILQSKVEEIHAAGATGVVLNLAETSILTSAGIRVLQKSHKLFKPEGPNHLSRLRLCGAQAQVLRALSMSGFLTFMPMYENIEAALKSLEG